jgi:glutathione S-transferase
MLELYHTATSTCSQKVRVTLAEKRLDFISRNINLRLNENLAPEYLKLNPNGVVPTLIHDGNVILDSSVICEYLDEVFPQPRLGPDNAVGRAHMRKWLRFIEEVPTAAIRVPTFHMALKPFEGVDQETYRAERADIRPLRKHFYRKMGAKGFSPEEVEASLENLDLTLRRMEEALTKGDWPWLMGHQFSLADIAVLPTLDRLDDLGMAKMWSGHPRVADWYARIKARPSYAAAFYPGSRISQSGVTIAPLAKANS